MTFKNLTSHKNLKMNLIETMALSPKKTLGRVECVVCRVGESVCVVLYQVRYIESMRTTDRASRHLLHRGLDDPVSIYV